MPGLLHEKSLCRKNLNLPKMNRILSIILRSMPLLFFVGVILTTITALLPSPLIPGVLQFWDKAQHACAYAVLAVTGVLSFPKNAGLVCLGLLFHGALIELMQLTLTTTRTGDVLDWFADGVGVLIGIGACASIPHASSRGNKKDDL